MSAVTQQQFLDAAAQLSPVEKEECARRAQIHKNELLALTNERLHGVELPDDEDARNKVVARVVFQIMADRYREEVVATVRAKGPA